MGTYSWGRRQGHELAVQCSVQSAGRYHSWGPETSTQQEELHLGDDVFWVTIFAFLKWHLEFFKLPQNHVVRHVVKEAVTGRQDDVAELHVERGAVSSIGAGRQTGGDEARSVTSGSGPHKTDGTFTSSSAAITFCQLPITFLSK